MEKKLSDGVRSRIGGLPKSFIWKKLNGLPDSRFLLPQLRYRETHK